jgi:acyl-CoA thioesterase I
VLIHLGTNNASIEELGAIIDRLRAVNDVVVVLLAQIIPRRDELARVRRLNALIPALAAQRSSARSPVLVVDQFTGFDMSTDLEDNAHPNDRGDRKMADRWYEALVPLLPAPD